VHAHVQKILFVENLGKIPENSGKIPENSEKWRPAFAEMHMKTFFGGHIKKMFHDLCGTKFVSKVVQKLFGQYWGNSGTNHSNPKKFACSCTYVLDICGGYAA